jgi:hypothetical protein
LNVEHRYLDHPNITIVVGGMEYSSTYCSDNLHKRLSTMIVQTMVAPNPELNHCYLHISYVIKRYRFIQ